jgi:hypothetical protein
MSKKLYGVFVFGILVAMMMTAFADTQCSGQDCSVSTSLTISNDAPTITAVESGIAVTLTAETTVTQLVQFNVTDTNGYGDLNDTTAQCIGFKSGEADRTSSSCGVISQTGNDKIYNCSVNLYYYDVDGADWGWNCSVSDNQESSDYDDTVTFTVNALHYIDQDITQMAWSSANSNTDDQEGDAPINLDNGGNQDYESCEVTAYDSTSGSNTIPATAFALNSATGTPAGTSMQNATATDISSWFTLPHGDGVSEDIFAYVDIPAVPSGTYTSTNNWLLDITA